ncbi:thymidine kinase, partial [Enterobacter hormaechei]|nr:thymidine kinase [Enterobacter hormaechei]
MTGWSVHRAADDGTKYGTMIHREYYTLIRVLRPMAQLYF